MILQIALVKPTYDSVTVQWYSVYRLLSRDGSLLPVGTVPCNPVSGGFRSHC